MKIVRARTLVTVLAALPLLALGACSANCHCPPENGRPAASTTYVTPANPPNSTTTTITTPNQYYASDEAGVRPGLPLPFRGFYC